MGGGMTDLNQNVIAQNTNTLSQMSEMGPTVRGGNAVNSSTCLTFNGSTASLASLCMSCIVKYTGNGIMWPIGLNSSNTGMEIFSNGAIRWAQANGSTFGAIQMTLNHWYYILGVNRSDSEGGSGWFVFTDLTSGLQQIVSNSTTGLGQLPYLTLMTAIQLNDTNTGAICPIAACHVAGNSQISADNSKQPRMDLGTLLEAASKPWSLWYA
jgi:hypothetical protein